MENQQPAWQKHLLLIVGVALPFALMVFVFAYQKIVIASVPDPRYTAVYADLDNNGYNGYYGGQFETRVVNNKLEVVYAPPKNSPTDFDPSHMRLRIFVLPPGDGVRPGSYDIYPTKDMTKDRTLLPLPEALKVKMIDGDEAPDGYRYRGYSYSDRGLINGILIGGSGRYESDVVIAKDGRAIPLPITGSDAASYYNVRFIGWVAE